METANEVILFVQQNLNALLVSLGVAAVVAVLCSPKVQDMFRGMTMKKTRREEVHTILTEGFVDWIEECVADELITRKEATEEGYGNLTRLYPKLKEIHASPEWLKERIERRLRAGVHADPAPLPDRKEESPKKTMLKA